MMIQNESVAFRFDLLFVNIKPYKSHISFKTLPHIYSHDWRQSQSLRKLEKVTSMALN